MRTYHDITGTDRSELAAQVASQRERVRARLAAVDRIIPITSGKGGVGKSFVSACVAAALGQLGRPTGLLDADLNGASARRLLDVRPGRLEIRDGAVVPPLSRTGVKLMSMDLLLDEGMPVQWREPESESFLWRGAQERGAVREFLSDVAWGDLDYLIIDLPPGAQRLADIAELVDAVTGCLVVTIPSEASRQAVGRAMRLAVERAIPLLGVVENMTGYVCPSCGDAGPLFAGAAGSTLAEAFDTPLLARIPFDPRAAGLADGGKLGRLLEETAAGSAIRDLVSAIVGREDAVPETDL